MPDTTTTAAPPDFLQYSPQDVMDHASKAGWTPEQTATALRKHRDNIAAYALDNEDASTGWKALHRLDVDTEHQLQQVRAMAGGAAVAQVLPDDNDRAQFAAQLEAGGFDPSAIDDQWQPAVQAWTQTLSNPAYSLPTRGKPRKFMVGDQHLGSYSEAPRSDGQSDHWFQPVSQDPAKPMQPFSVRLPTVTDDEVKAELDKKQQELNDAADNWGLASEKLRKDEGSVAERDKWQEKTKQARAELDALKQHGREMLTEQRLRETLKQPQYAGKVGEYHGLMEAGKDLIHAAAGFAGLFARDYDIVASQPFLDSPLETLRKMRAHGVDGLLGQVSGDMDAGALRKVNEVTDTINDGLLHGSSTRRDLEGGGWNNLVRGVQALPAMQLQMATGGTGMMASVAGEREMEAQKRIDAAIAAGDYETAKRIEQGRDLHAVATGALMAGFGKALRVFPLVNAATNARGFMGSALNTAVGAGEMKGMSMVQRAVVDPMIGDHADDVGGDWSELALGGLMSLGAQGMHRAMNGPRPPAGPTRTTRSMDRESLTTNALGRFAELQHKLEAPVQGAKAGDSLPLDMRKDANLTPDERAEYDALHGALTTPTENGTLAFAPNHPELARLYGVKLTNDFANVTDGSPTEAKPGPLPASEVSGDAGSTPAVGALSPGDVHPENGKTVEAVMTGADGVRHLAYTDGTSESIAPNSKSPAPEEAAQNAAVEAALAGGPKSMMDVATRAGQVDSPRLQFSYKNTPDSLMGFPREGPTKPFEQQNYRHVQPVEVTFADGTSHVDAVKGLNREHAMERARRNWPGATIEPVSMQRLQLSRARGMPDGGKLPITDAPPVVPIPQVTVARHPGGMVEGLRQWLVSAKDDLLTRLKAKSPDAITADFDKLKQYKSGENALHHFQAVAALPELYEHSRVAAIQPDRKDATSGMRYERRYAWATFPDGKRRHVLITSRLFHEANKPTKVYSLETMEVEVREAPLTYTDSAARETTKPFDQGAHPVKDGVSVHEFLAGVKPEHRAAPSNNGAVPLSARVKNTAKVAQEAARLLNNQLPGIVGPKLTFVANPAELLASNYAAENSFTAEEQAQMQNAEGFFDNDTGHTIIFTDAIEVRPGESERAAVARVILHERVGHDGFNHLYDRDPQFKATWDNIVKDIDSTELDAIAHDYPNLAGDRNQLALEWFARQVERIAAERTGARIDGSLKGTLRQMWDAFKALYARVFKGFAQSLQTEHDLRQLITKATDAARNGTAIPTTAEGMRLQFSRLDRIRHKEGEPFKVRALGLQALRTGSPLPRSLHEVLHSTQAERSALDNAFARVASMIDVGAKEAAQRTGQPIATIYDGINAALDGQPGAMTVLQVTDPALAEATRRGRNMLDDMSQLIANTLPTSSPARLAIIGNMGHWMRRSYQVFDASAGWNYDTLMSAAEAGKQLNGEDARTIVREAASYLVAQDATLQGQRQSNGLPIKDSALDLTMQELATRDTWTNSLVPGSGRSPRKNVSSLIARKILAPELRRFMGEHTNPLNRFATSASFQTQFVAKHHGLQAMRSIILQSGLGSQTKSREFSVSMADNEGWNPLNDIHVTPELKAAIQSVSTIDQAGAANIGGNLWKLLKSFTANAKMANVPLHPKSTMTNIIGGAVSTLQTGDLYAPEFVNRWVNAWKASRDGTVSAKEMTDLTTVGLRDAEAQLRSELIAHGVLDSNLTLEEFRAGNAEYLIKIFGDDPAFQKAANAALGAAHGAAIGNAFGRIGGLSGQLGGMAAGGAIGAAIGGKSLIAFNQFLAKWTIGKSDALFKITGYLAQLRTAQLAGVPNPQAWAAERVRNTYPTYDKVPAWLRSLSLTPLMTNFIAFKYEVPRNAIWNLRYGLQDIRSSNPVIRAAAARRLSGAALVWGGLALGAGAVGSALFGWTPPDDEKKRIFKRWLSPDYEKDQTLTFKAWDKDGVTYFNHAYLVPQVEWTDFVRIAASDAAEGEWDKAIFGSMGRFFRMAGLGNNMANTMIEAYNNRDRFGKKITSDPQPADSTLDTLGQYARRADHVAYTYTDPGYAKFAVELIRSKGLNLDQAATDRLYNGALGIRDRHVTWDKATKTATYQFRDQLQSVRDTLDNALDPKKATLATDRQASLTRANQQLGHIAEQLAQFERDMARIGVPRDTVLEAKRAAGLSTSGIKLLNLDPTGKKAVTTSKPVR